MNLLFYCLSLFFMTSSIGSFQMGQTPKKVLRASWFAPSAKDELLEKKRNAAAILTPYMNKWNLDLSHRIKVQSVLMKKLDSAHIKYQQFTDNLKHKKLFNNVHNEVRKAYMYQGRSIVHYAVPYSNQDFSSVIDSTLMRAQNAKAFDEHSVSSLISLLDSDIDRLKKICLKHSINIEPEMSEVNEIFNKLQEPDINCVNSKNRSGLQLDEVQFEYEGLYKIVDGFDYIYSPDFFSSSCQELYIEISNSDKWHFFPESFNKSKYNRYLLRHWNMKNDFHDLYDMSRRLSTLSYQLERAWSEFYIIYKDKNMMSLFNEEDISPNFLLSYYGNNKKLAEDFWPTISPSGRQASINKQTRILSAEIKRLFMLLDGGTNNDAEILACLEKIKIEYEQMRKYMYSLLSFIHLMNALYTNELDEGL